MDERKTAYMVLMAGIVTSFTFFIGGLTLAEFGLGRLLVTAGATILTLTPLAMIFGLIINYITNDDYKWSLFGIIILSIILISALTTYLLR